MRTMIGICRAKPGRRTFGGCNGLVKMHRSTDTSAVHPETLASEFLVVLD